MHYKIYRPNIPGYGSMVVVDTDGNQWGCGADAVKFFTQLKNFGEKHSRYSGKRYSTTFEYDDEVIEQVEKYLLKQGFKKAP
jgi:hypothetical protein